MRKQEHPVITNVEKHLNLKGINKKCRVRKYAEARFIAMYILKHSTTMSLSEIGEVCGNRDHTSVVHGIKTMSNLLEQKKYKQKYQELLNIYKIKT